MDQTPIPNETDEQRDIRMNKDLAAVSYLWIVSIAAYASRRDSKFVQYHSKQGIVLFLLSIPVYLIPYVGQYLVFFVVAGMLLGFINAAQGRTADVPFAGPLSRGELKFSDITASVPGMKSIVDAVKKMFRSSDAPKAPEPSAPQSSPGSPGTQAGPPTGQAGVDTEQKSQ